MAKQLNVNLAFTADTSKASKDIQSLQQQLTQLMNSAMGNSKTLGLTKDIKEATTAVAQLKAQLSGAMSSTGTLDLTKFNDSLEKSGMTLEDYRRKLSALGPEGTQAFSQLASSISSAEIPLKQANNLVKEFSTTLMNTARWQLSSSLLHGFIGGLQQAYGYAQDLNTSLNNIRIVTGQSTDQMAQFAEKANKAARELSARTTDYTKGALIYYQQGLDDKAVEERTRTTLKLANVTRQSAEEVSNQMTAIWNNFDDGTKKLEYYADAITALGAKTASSSSEIAQGLSKFAAVADTIGLSYETAAASIATVVAETRQSADTVGNAFKAIFSRIQSLKLGETLEDGVGLTKYTQALEAVGVKVLDINGELREADDILSDLGDRWQQISDSQKNALAQTVAGQRQYSQFIALFDNWEKVQQNTDIAAGSEGTLQTQADIYAESWEASATRVRAALESIYSSLIDDDFFIGFNNLLAGLIDRINGLIKGLGGIPGVLTTIGGLLSRTFSSQVASNIDRIIDNITKKSIKGAQQQQQNAINALQKEADLKAGSGSKQGQAQSEGLRTQAALQQTLLNNQAKYNEEELRTAQNILDQNANLREQARLAGEISDKKKQSAASEQNRFMRDFGSLSTNIEKYVQDLKNCNEQQALVQSSATTLSGILASDFENPTKQAELFFNEINEIKEGINLLGNVENSSLKGLVEEFNRLFDAFEKGDQSEATMKKIISVLQQIGAAASDAGIQIENDLVRDLDALGEDKANVSARVAKLSNSFREAGDAAATSGEKMKAMKNGAEAGAEAMDKMGQKSLSAGQMISGFSSDIFALASVINTIKGAINTLNNEDLTFGEKMMAIIPSLLITLASLTNTLTGLGGAALVAAGKHLPLIGAYVAEEAAAAGATATTLSLGAAIKVALPLLAGIGAAIAAVVVVIGAVIKAIDDAIETPKEKAERLQKEVDNASKAFDNAKTAVDNLKSAFDGYDSVKSTLDECKTGTTEWYDALNDVNNKVLEILQQYPELAKYLTKDENGVLGFSQEGKDFVLNQQKQNLQIANSTQMRATIEQKQNDVDIERSELIKDYTNLLTGVFSENIQYSEEIGENLEEVAANIADGKIKLEDVVGDLNAEDLVRRVASDQTPWNYAEKNEQGEYTTDYDSALEALRTYATDITDSMSQEDIEAKILGDWETIHLAQSNYGQSLSILADMNTDYGKVMAEGKVKEELKNNPYVDQISAMSDKLYNSLYNQNASQNESKNDSILAEEFYNYVNKNNVKGYEGLTKSGKYTDENGDTATVSRETMIAALSAADALNSIVDSAIEVGKTFERLDKSGNEADKALMDIVATGEINQNGNALRQEYKKESAQINGFMEGAGEKKLSEEEIAKMYLTSKLGDLEALAVAQGLDSSEEIIKAFLEGMSNYDKAVDDARNTGSHFLNKVYNQIVEANEEQVNNLSIENQEKIGNLLKQSVTSGGLEGLNIIQDILSNTTDLESTIEGLSGEDINWATISIGELKDKLSEFGVNVKEIDNSKLQTLIDSMQQIGDINFDSAADKYKKIHDIVDDLKTGDTISGEDFKEVLEPLDPEKMNQYFTAMADGTYKLTGDATEFYNFINSQSLTDFKKGIEEASQKLGNISSLNEYREHKNGKDITEEAVTRDSEGKISGYKQAQIDAQIKYLSLLDLEEEQQTKLAVIKADAANNDKDGTMQVQNLKDLMELMEIYGEDWEKVDEASQQASENLEKNRLAIEGTAPNLQMLYKLFQDGEFGKNANWKEIAKEWKELFFDESNIATLQDFKNTLEEIGPTAEESISTLNPEEAKIKWDEIKDSIDLTVNDLEEFSSLKNTLSLGQMAEGYKEIAESASSIEELDQIILAAQGTGIDFTNIIIELLNQSDMTTAETIRALVDEIVRGNGEADKLLQKIKELYQSNDNEETTEQSLEDMRSSYDQVRAGTAKEREKIYTSSQGKPNEAEQKRLDELNDVDRQTDIAEGLSTIEYAKNSTDMFDETRLQTVKEGLALIGDTADLTDTQLVQMGADVAAVANSFDSWGNQEQKADLITQAFGGKEAIQESSEAIKKIYADTIKDFYLSGDDFKDLPFSEQLEQLGEKLTELGVPTEYLKGEIVDLLNINEGSTLTQLENLQKLLDEGLIDSKKYGEESYNTLANSDVSFEAKMQAAKAINQTQKENILQNNSIYAGVGAPQVLSDEGSQQLEQANQQLANAVQGFNGAEAGSFESLSDNFNDLPDYVDKIHMLQDATAEYAGKFSDLTERAAAWKSVLQGASEEERAAMQVEMERAVRAQEMAQAYDLDAEALEEYARAEEENIELTQEAIDAGVTKSKIAIENAKTQMRLNKSLENSQKNLKNYESIVDDVAKAEKSKNAQELANIKTSEKTGKTYQGVIKDLAGILDVSEDLMKNNFNKLLAKDADSVKKALAGEQDGIDACKDSIGDMILAGTDWAKNMEDSAQGASDKMQEAFSGMDVGDFMPATDDILAPLNEAYEQGKIGFDELCEYLRSQDMEPEFDWGDAVRAAVDDAEAAAAASEAGDIFVEKNAVEGEMEPVEGDATTEHETVGYTENLTITRTTVPVAYQENANAAPQTGTVAYAYATKTVTPDIQTEEGQEHTETTVPKLKGATKTAGGASKGSGGGGGGGGGCFVAGTLISTSVGFKNIEDIKVGDVVLSYNEKLRRNEYSTVRETMIHIINDDIYTLYIQNEKLVVTGIHRFLITRNNKREWIPASELKIGDLVLLANGSLNRIFRIDINFKFLQVVYNFEVSDNHNYYVGKNKILAHNKGGGGRGRETKAKTATRTKTITKAENVDRYHKLDQSLKSLTHSYTDINIAKERAFGMNHIKMIDKEIAAKDRLIKKNEEYLASIKDWEQKDRTALLNQTKKDKASQKQVNTKGKKKTAKEKATKKGNASGLKKELGNAAYTKKIWTGKTETDDSGNITYKLDEVTRYANADATNFLGMDVQYDQYGNISNYDELVAKAQEIYNKNQVKKTKIKDEDYFNLKEAKGKKGRKAYIKNLQLINETNMVDSQFEQFMANIDQVEESAELRAQKIQEIIDSYIEQEALKLEQIDYKINLKVELKDSEIERIQFILDRLGDSAMNSVRAITNIGEAFKATKDKVDIAKQGIKDLFGLIDRNAKDVKKVTGNDGITHSFWTNNFSEEEKAKARDEKSYQIQQQNVEITKQNLAVINDQLTAHKQELYKNSGLEEQKEAEIRKAQTAAEKQLAKLKGKKNKEARKKIKENLEKEKKTIEDKYSKKEESLYNNDSFTQTLLKERATRLNEVNEAQAQLDKSDKIRNNYLEGNKDTQVVEDFIKNGANSHWIKDLAERKDEFSEEWVNNLTEKTKQFKEAVEELFDLRSEIFERLSAALDEYNAKIDDIIARQEHLNNTTTHYYNIIELIHKNTLFNGDGIREQARAYEAEMDELLRQQKNQNIKNYDVNLETEKKYLESLQSGRDNAISELSKYYVYNEKTGFEYDEHGQYKTKTGEALSDVDQAAADIWADDLRMWNESVQESADKVRELEEGKQQAFEDALQTNEEIWERAMERAAAEYSETMAKNAVTLDYLSEGLERYTKTHSIMVQDYEKMHQLRQMELDAQKSIDEATDPKIKRELLAIQEEITQHQKDGAEMSQYDLTYLKQRLELKQAEAALDDAQAEKSQVSLTRDNEGNYGYVYTADEEDVADAEKNYEDKLYEMKKSNQEYIDEMQKQLVKIEKECQEKIAAIRADTSLSEEEQNAMIREVLKDYTKMYFQTGKELENALNRSTKIFGEYSDIYASITGDITAQNQVRIDNFKDTQLSEQTGFESIEEMADTWATAMGLIYDKENGDLLAMATDSKELLKELGIDYEVLAGLQGGYLGEMQKANNDYKANTQTTVQDAGYALGEMKDNIMPAFAEQVKQKMGEAVEDTKKLEIESEELQKNSTENLDKIKQAIVTFENTYNQQMAQAVVDTQNLTEAINALKEAIADLVAAADKLASIKGAISNVTSSSSSRKTWKNVGRKTRGGGTKKLKNNRRSKRWISRMSVKQAKQTKVYKRTLRAQKKNNKSNAERRKVALNATKKKLKKILNQSNYKGIILKYDTGGYTGDWAGNEGRAALLHKKELVLNQKDTANILSAVSMIKGLSEKIDLNALASSGAFRSFGVNRVNSMNNELEQNVHIEANFPNATSREEIQAAFENLIGLASQYANRTS